MFCAVVTLVALVLESTISLVTFPPVVKSVTKPLGDSLLVKPSSLSLFTMPELLVILGYSAPGFACLPKFPVDALPRVAIRISGSLFSIQLVI